MARPLKAAVSPKEKAYKELAKWVEKRPKKHKTREDVKALLEKLGYAVKSASAVAPFYDSYLFGLKVTGQLVVAEPEKKAPKVKAVKPQVVTPAEQAVAA